MSFITGIPSETLYSSTNDGTALATFTSEASLTAGLTGALQPALPAFFFYNASSVGKRVRLYASGILGTTASPTFTFFIRLGTTLNVVTGTSIGQSVAMTGANVANSYWQATLDLTCRVPGYGGGNATIAAQGNISSPAGLATPFTYALTPAASATGWTFTIDATATQFFQVSASCSVSNAANTIQLKDLVCQGLN